MDRLHREDSIVEKPNSVEPQQYFSQLITITPILEAVLDATLLVLGPAKSEMNFAYAYPALRFRCDKGDIHSSSP